MDWQQLSNKGIQEGSFLRGMHKLYKTYGRTFQVQSSGTTTIHTVEPANVKSILALNADSYETGAFRYSIAGPVIGHSIFTTDGAFWKHYRVQIKPIFMHAQRADLSDFLQHLDGFLDRLPRDASPFDMAPALNELFFNSSLDFLFGQSHLFPGVDHTAANKRFQQVFQAAMAGAGRRRNRSRLSKWRRDVPFDEACVETHAFADGYIEAAIQYLKNNPSSEVSEQSADSSTGKAATAASRTRPVLLFELIKRNPGASRASIRSQLLGVFLGGHDSTSILVANALFLLSRSADAWTKLREEALRLRGSQQELSFAQLKSLTYLRYVLNETLRLHPIPISHTRRARHDTILPTGGGSDGCSPVFVAKGVSVALQGCALHSMETTFGNDAQEFRPERWVQTRPGWGYIPFGGGPRTCPAQQFALAEASVTLVRLAWEFKALESRDDRDFVEQLHLTRSNRNGCIISLVPE